MNRSKRALADEEGEMSGFVRIPFRALFSTNRVQTGIARNSPLAHSQQLWLAIIRISHSAFKPMMKAPGSKGGR
jgi:hypothetical protein